MSGGARLGQVAIGDCDPMGLRSGFNSYAYLDGNPLVGLDPSGLKRWDQIEQRNRTMEFVPEGIRIEDKMVVVTYDDHEGGIYSAAAGALAVVAGTIAVVIPEPVSTSLGGVAAAWGAGACVAMYYTIFPEEIRREEIIENSIIIPWPRPYTP